MTGKGCQQSPAIQVCTDDDVEMLETEVESALFAENLKMKEPAGNKKEAKRKRNAPVTKATQKNVVPQKEDEGMVGPHTEKKSTCMDEASSGGDFYGYEKEEADVGDNVDECTQTDVEVTTYHKHSNVLISIFIFR